MKKIELFQISIIENFRFGFNISLLHLTYPETLKAGEAVYGEIFPVEPCTISSTNFQRIRKNVSLTLTKNLRPRGSAQHSVPL